MKITLINLSNTDRVSGRGKPTFPLTPYSLLLLAALIRRHGGFEVEIIDEDFDAVSFRTLDTDCVGLSVNSRISRRAYRIADTLRARGITVLLGGPHPTVVPEEARRHCDALVRGEAEDIIDVLLDDLEAGRLKQVYRNEHVPSLQGRPVVDHSLVNPDNYLLQAVSTTRGCPYNCEFCSVHSIYGRKIRTRPIDDVIEEVGRATKTLFFTDDNVFARRSYSSELLRRLAPLRVKWGAQACIGVGKDDELLELARASGCLMLFVGMETVNPKNLEGIGKPQNRVDEYKALIRNIHAHGINIQGSFIVGLDDDDLSSFAALERFIDESGIDTIHLQILKPYPGTRLRDRLAREGRLLSEDDWDNLSELRIDYVPRLIAPDRLVQEYRNTLERITSIERIERRLQHAPNREIASMLNMSQRHKLMHALI
jgi:radical SAM superfamily enzyme YgiQ (UPF0313 family)